MPRVDLSQIHFHDSEIQRVVELPALDELCFHLLYPGDGYRFEPHVIAFCDVLDYAVHEGPFAGAPTILRVEDLGRREGHALLRVETTAGFRTLRCTGVELRLTERT